MFLLTILDLGNFLLAEYLETIEISITFDCLFGINFYLLMTAENKKISETEIRFFKIIFIIF